MWATDVRAFVVGHADLAQGLVDQVQRALNLALLVGVFDAQDERATERPGDQVFVQGGTEIADMHHAGRAGRITGADSGCCHGKPL